MKVQRNATTECLDGELEGYGGIDLRNTNVHSDRCRYNLPSDLLSSEQLAIKAMNERSFQKPSKGRECCSQGHKLENLILCIGYG